MSLDDYVEPEVMIAVAVTAAVASPQVRRVVRKGAVYGLAGLMSLGDRVKTVAGSVAQAAKNTVGEAKQAAEPATTPAVG